MGDSYGNICEEDIDADDLPNDWETEYQSKGGVPSHNCDFTYGLTFRESRQRQVVRYLRKTSST